MTTMLQGPLKREIHIAGEAYTLTLSPEGMHLARKGHRKGRQLSWADLVNDETALKASPRGGGEGGRDDARNGEGAPGPDQSTGPVAGVARPG